MLLCFLGVLQFVNLFPFFHCQFVRNCAVHLGGSAFVRLGGSDCEGLHTEGAPRSFVLGSELQGHWVICTLFGREGGDAR